MVWVQHLQVFRKFYDLKIQVFLSMVTKLSSFCLLVLIKTYPYTEINKPVSKFDWLHFCEYKHFNNIETMEVWS